MVFVELIHNSTSSSCDASGHHIVVVVCSITSGSPLKGLVYLKDIHCNVNVVDTHMFTTRKILELFTNTSEEEREISPNRMR